ncbi:MAG TPA: phosphate/phosphite/phosphonate ABC transporter substrate-binding protein [Gemmatimonadales bacterium]
MPATYRLSYYPWLTQNVPAAEIHREIERFAREVEKQLSGITIQVLPTLEVGPQIDLLLAGGCDIALMNPLGYVFARRRAAENRKKDNPIHSIAIALRIIDGKVGDKYFGQVYARDTSALRKDDPGLFAKMRGRSIGYGVAYSTSNFLIPAYELLKRGVHPFTAFSRVEFLGGHDIAARAVYEGKVDLGVGHDGVIVDLGNQYGYGDATKRMSTLVRSDPIPSDPVVVRMTDPAQRKALQAALVKAGKTKDGKAALSRFWGLVQGLAPIGPDEYEILNTAMTALKLEEQHLLKKS